MQLHRETFRFGWMGTGRSTDGASIESAYDPIRANAHWEAFCSTRGPMSPKRRASAGPFKSVQFDLAGVQ